MSRPEIKPAFPSPSWEGVRGGGNVHTATRYAIKPAGPSSKRGKFSPPPFIPPHKEEGGVDAAPRPNRATP